MKDGLNSLTALLVNWRFQTVLLAMLPHASLNGLAQALPLHATLTPLSIALVVVVFSVRFGLRQNSDRWGVMRVVGVSATILYALVETYALTLGRGYITDSLHLAVHSAAVVLEQIASVLAYAWWCLIVPDGPERGERSSCLLVCLSGIILPLLFDGIASFVPLPSVLLTPAACIASGALCYLVVVRRQFIRLDCPCAMSFMIGLMVYQILSSFTVGLNPVYGFYSEFPSGLWFPVCIFLIVMLLICQKCWRMGRARSQKYVSRGSNRPSVPSLPSLAGACVASLSERERTVAACLVRGLSREQISEALGISRSTVSIYCSRVLHKLEVQSVAGLQGLVDEGEIWLIDTSMSIPAVANPRSSRMSDVAFLMSCCVAVALLCTLSLFVPYQLELPNGSVVYQFFTYVCWVLAIVAHLIALASFDGFSMPNDAQTSSLDKAIDFMFLVGSILVAFQAGGFGTWAPVGSVLEVAIIVIAGLFACVYAQAKTCGGTDERARLLYSMRVISRRAGQPWCMMVFGSALIVSQTMAAIPPLWSLRAIAVVLLLGTSCWIVVQEKLGLQKDDGGEPNEEARLATLLRRHGMGELQTQIILDCVQGLSIKQTCERRNTTQNTVKSYRKRTYRQFDVSSASELRDKLRRELETTKVG